MGMQDRKAPYRSLTGLTGGFLAMFQGTERTFVPRLAPNKQTSENQSRLMIAENPPGGGTGKLHRGLGGTPDRTAPRTNRNMEGR